MKALSIKQPWAWLICAGYKDYENRDWSLPKSFYLPQRIYIHAGKRVDDKGAVWLWDNKERLGIQGIIKEWTDICNFWKGSFLIGSVDIVGQIIENDLRWFGNPKWFTGEYGFLLANPTLFNTPIPYKGRLGFFEVEIEV